MAQPVPNRPARLGILAVNYASTLRYYVLVSLRSDGPCWPVVGAVKQARLIFRLPEPYRWYSLN